MYLVLPLNYYISDGSDFQRYRRTQHKYSIYSKWHSNGYFFQWHWKSICSYVESEKTKLDEESRCGCTGKGKNMIEVKNVEKGKVNASEIRWINTFTCYSRIPSVKLIKMIASISSIHLFFSILTPSLDFPFARSRTIVNV